MTEYRTVHDGYCEWLQYKDTRYTGWWIFKRLTTKWYLIRTDYYDYFDEQWEAWEREGGYSGYHRNYHRYINSTWTNIDRFIEQYPAVDDWLAEREKIVNKKRIAAYKEREERESKMGAIKIRNKAPK